MADLDLIDKNIVSIDLDNDELVVVQVALMELRTRNELYSNDFDDAAVAHCADNIRVISRVLLRLGVK